MSGIKFSSVLRLVRRAGRFLRARPVVLSPRRCPPLCISSRKLARAFCSILFSVWYVCVFLSACNKYQDASEAPKLRRRRLRGRRRHKSLHYLFIYSSFCPFWSAALCPATFPLASGLLFIELLCLRFNFSLNIEQTRAESSARSNKKLCGARTILSSLYVRFH